MVIPDPDFDFLPIPETGTKKAPDLCIQEHSLDIAGDSAGNFLIFTVHTID